MIKLEEGEQIIAEYKKHWWVMFTWAFSLFVLAILPIGLIFAVKFFTSFIISLRVMYLISFFYTLWLSVIWIIVFVEWTDYYLDVWIITNHRIIDIEQKGLFFKDEATIRLEDVRDIKIEYHGIIQSLFKFGGISVQSSGARTEFFIDNVVHPEDMKNTIYNYIDLAKKAKYD